MTWPLHYVCKWCGCTVATYQAVRSAEPATLSVCDKRECRAAASAAYRGIA